MKVSGCVPAAVVVLSGAVASFSITAIASFVLIHCQSRGLLVEDLVSFRGPFFVKSNLEC